MLVYKFRPSEKLDWVIDIVNNRRLHCSDWSVLNDPLEGCFYYSEDYSERLAPLVSAKKKFGMRSFQDISKSVVVGTLRQRL